MELSKKSIIVAGGAGLLGSALVKRLGELGASITLADSSLPSAQGAVDRLKRAGLVGSVESAFIDITDSSSLRKVFADHTDRFGLPSGFVNCAYPRNQNYGRKLEDVEYKDFVENLGIHLGGYFLATKEYALYCRKAGLPSSIVNISSIYGVVTPRFEIYEGTSTTMPVEYAAIKSGLIHLTKYFARYFSESGIRFNAVSPGGIANGQSDQFMRQYRRYALSKGMLSAEDVCGAICFLLSDDSQFINGQNLVVDDGWSL